MLALRPCTAARNGSSTTCFLLSDMAVGDVDVVAQRTMAYRTAGRWAMASNAVSQWVARLLGAGEARLLALAGNSNGAKA